MSWLLLHACVRCEQTLVTVSMVETRLTPAPAPGRGPHRGLASHNTDTCEQAEAEARPQRCNAMDNIYVQYTTQITSSNILIQFSTAILWPGTMYNFKLKKLFHKIRKKTIEVYNVNNALGTLCYIASDPPLLI